jgi:replication initiation and membrane attachment protein
MKRGINFMSKSFDLDACFSGIASFITINDLSDSVKATIENIATFYLISPEEMTGIIISAVNVDGTINEEELIKVASDYYEFSKDTLHHRIADRVEKDIVEKVPQTNEEKLIAYFETTSPRQFLEFLANGAKPSQVDLNIVEQIMIHQKLSPGVMNVLLHYVLNVADMKLIKNYIEKIASHWARKNIQTVKEAWDVCINENKQYRSWIHPTKLQSTKKYQEVPNGKLLNLFLLESSHRQLIYLTNAFGFQKDEQTIAHLLNEAYIRNK